MNQYWQRELLRQIECKRAQQRCLSSTRGTGKEIRTTTHSGVDQLGKHRIQKCPVSVAFWGDAITDIRPGRLSPPKKELRIGSATTPIRQHVIKGFSNLRKRRAVVNCEIRRRFPFCAWYYGESTAGPRVF